MVVLLHCYILPFSPVMCSGTVDVNITVGKPSSAVVDICYAAGSVGLLMFASLLCSIASKKCKRLKARRSGGGVSSETPEAAAGAFRTSDDEDISWKSASDVLLGEDKEDPTLESDAKYAEELQVQEALLASIFASQTKNTPSTSTPKARPSLSSLLNNEDNETANPPQSFCGICLENKETWLMLGNSACSHSFCYKCTAEYASTKIQENASTSITCPGLNCKSSLDVNACRLIVPKDVLVKWDESLCKSTILETHKLYCPFADCSVLMINDGGGITKTDCPLCRRPFCAACRVPWHSEFTCKEFEKLNNKKKGKKEDEMTEALAKKKKWRKCPNCKFFVEKAEGCLHITCRCKHEFCYKCGANWSSHGSCRP